MRILSDTHALASVSGDQIPSGSSPSRLGELSATSSGRWWENLGVCIFLAGIIWFVFGQTLGHDFVDYDDGDYVYQNGRVAGGLTPRGVAWAFTAFHAANWHPVTWISHMLDCQIYGIQPWGHHFSNVVLHAGAAILLFLVLQKMTASLWPSAFVAAVFAIHPQRVESVAWVSERKDVLSAVFFMLTLAGYLRYTRSEGRSVGRYLMMLILFVLGLMSKPMLVTLPFVLLLLDYWPLRRFTKNSNEQARFCAPWNLILEKLPLLALSFASCATTFLAQHRGVVPTEQLSLSYRTANALFSYVAYLGQMLDPSNLAVLYPHPAGSLLMWEVALSLALLLAISTGTFLWRQQRPYLLVGWLWYLGMLVPVIGMLQVGLQARADRYTYLPEIGIYIMVAWFMADFSSRSGSRRRISAVIAVFVITALAWCARTQTSYWRDAESLWLHTIACTSRNAVAHSNLAITYLRKGRIDEAITECERALDIKPNYAEAHCNLANAMLRKGQTNEAIVHCKKAIKIRPEYAQAYCDLGSALLQKGRLDEALVHFRKAIELNPDYADAYCCLGATARQKGRVDEAMQAYRKALDIWPDHEMANYNLANALIQSGQINEAIIHYQKALEAKPDYTEAHYNLGKAFAQIGHLDQAIYHFRKVLAISPMLAAAHADLGSALAQRGSEGEAIHQLEMALAIAPQYVPAQYSLAWVLATSSNAVLRDGRKAVELAQRASQQNSGKDPFILCTLAAAYAEAGLFSEAGKTVSLALELAKTRSDTDLTKQLQAQLKLYQSNLPFHQAFAPVAPPLPAPKPPPK